MNKTIIRKAPPPDIEWVKELVEREGLGLKTTNAVIEGFPDTKAWCLAGHAWIEAYYAQIGFERMADKTPELVSPFDNQIFMRKLVGDDRVELPTSSV